jgi:hypothetical protein
VREALLQYKLSRVPLAKQGRVTKQACRSNVCWKPSQEEMIEAEDQCLNRAAWVDLLSLNLSSCAPTSEKRPLTGEPYARNSPVRFGGRGGVQSPFLPLSTLRN